MPDTRFAIETHHPDDCTGQYAQRSRPGAPFGEFLQSITSLSFTPDLPGFVYNQFVSLDVCSPSVDCQGEQHHAASFISI